MEIAIVVVIVFVVYLATITHAEKQKNEEQRSQGRQEELERQVTYIEKAEAAKDKDRYMNFDCHFCDFVWEATPNEILEKDKEGMHMTCPACAELGNVSNSPYWEKFDFD